MLTCELISVGSMQLYSFVRLPEDNASTTEFACFTFRTEIHSISVTDAGIETKEIVCWPPPSDLETLPNSTVRTARHANRKVAAKRSFIEN